MMPGKFEWDVGKAQRNEAKHGVPFEYAMRVFLDPAHADFDVSRVADGEFRRNAVGFVEGKLYSVVYTMRA